MFAKTSIAAFDACKANVRARLFRANFKNALYQGTALVVPKKSSKYLSFQPLWRYFTRRSASGNVRRLNLPGGHCICSTQ
jgi:hypothetical protein